MRAALFPLAVLLTITLSSPAVGTQSGPALDVAPQHLSFIGSDKADRLAAQTVQVRNAGGGQLAWRARASVSWVTVTPDRGLAPASVRIGVDAQALAPGRHAARVVIESAGAARSPQTIDVDVAITTTRPAAPPGLTVEPDRVAFSAPAGETRRMAFSLRVSADQGAAIRWSARADVPWLELAPREGTTPADITLSASPAPLAPGDHAAAVLISTGDRGPALKVPVTFSVHAAGGRLALTSTSLPAAILNIPYSQALPVRGGQPPYSLQIAGSLPRELALVNGVITGTPRIPGMFAFTVMLSDSADPPAAVTETLTLPVVILDQNTALAVQPEQVQLATSPERAPRPVTVKVASGGPPLTWKVSSDAAWVQIESPTGVAPGTFTVGAAGKGLKAGIYTATLTVTMPGVPNSPLQIPVQMTVK